MKHLKYTYLEQIQYCTNLPLQVTLPAYPEQEKIGPGLESTLPLNRRMRRRAREERKQGTDFKKALQKVSVPPTNLGTTCQIQLHTCCKLYWNDILLTYTSVFSFVQWQVRKF